MNYRRGLFRLWLILTVLWIAVVALLFGPDINLEFRRAAAEENVRARQTVAEAATVNRFAKYKAVVEKDGLLLNIGRYEILIEDKDFFQLSPEAQQARVDKIESELEAKGPEWAKSQIKKPNPFGKFDPPGAKPVPADYDRAINPWPKLVEATKLAFLPPLALLALGAALGWALSGFQRP